MSYGPQRLIEELKAEGHTAELVKGTDNQYYAVIKGFEVPLGQFEGRVIDLGIPAPPDYGRRVGPSIHIKSSPVLLDFKDRIPGKRNIIESKLGPEWRYWSYRFNCDPENPTKALIAQIQKVFKDV